MVVGNQSSGVGDLTVINGATLTIDGLLILANAGKSTGYNNVYLAGTINAMGGIVAGAMATGTSTRGNPSLEVTDPGSGLFTSGANVTLRGGRVCLNSVSVPIDGFPANDLHRLPLWGVA